ncbi:uncharacterized protein [Argopecten irradians]|uniref:uncharacterized protein n=1 Tax=Argopecten irradians TaxID=31199 RepID=UPI00371C7398
MDTLPWKQELENEMVHKLSEYIHPLLKDRWAEFDVKMSVELSPVCRSNLKNIYDAFTALRNKEVISLGRYDVIRSMLSPIHVVMGEIIDTYTAKMEGVKSEMEAGESEMKGAEFKLVDEENTSRDSLNEHTRRVLEKQMAVKLADYLHPRLKSQWATFDCYLSVHLDTVCRAKMENIYMVIEELSRRRLISVGDYRLLRELVTPVHVDMGRIIDEYTEMIREA